MHDSNAILCVCLFVCLTCNVCLADTWYTNGTVSVPNTGFEGRISGTYQPVWDAWQRFIQPLVSNVSFPAPCSLTCRPNRSHVVEMSFLPPIWPGLYSHTCGRCMDVHAQQGSNAPVSAVSPCLHMKLLPVHNLVASRKPNRARV